MKQENKSVIEKLALSIEADKEILTKDEIYDWYYNKRKSLKTIGTVMKVNYITMNHLFIHWGWKPRPRGNPSSRIVDVPFVEVPQIVLTENDFEEDIKTAIYK